MLNDVGNKAAELNLPWLQFSRLLQCFVKKGRYLLSQWKEKDSEVLRNLYCVDSTDSCQYIFLFSGVASCKVVISYNLYLFKARLSLSCFQQVSKTINAEHTFLSRHAANEDNTAHLQSTSQADIDLKESLQSSH